MSIWVRNLFYYCIPRANMQICIGMYKQGNQLGDAILFSEWRFCIQTFTEIVLYFYLIFYKE